MAAVTDSTPISAQGVIKIFTFSSVDAGDTFVGPSSPKAYWAQVQADPTTDTSAGINVAESSGTYTFYPGVDSLAVQLFVVV